MLGLALVTGDVSFAQEKDTTKSTSKKKSKSKKKSTDKMTSSSHVK